MSARRKGQHINLSQVINDIATTDPDQPENPAPVHHPDHSAPADQQHAAPDNEPTPQPRRRGRPRTRPVGESTTLVLWCPEAIRARMRAVQASRGTKFLDQVLDALEANADDLDALVAGAAPQVQHGRLFDRIAPREQAAEVRVQVTIRGALPSHLAIIDQLVDTTGASSRSALLTAALDKHLPQRPRSMR